jgi:hypothetical protein
MSEVVVEASATNEPGPLLRLLRFSASGSNALRSADSPSLPASGEAR